MKKSKRLKPSGPVSVREYKYDPGNVFARLQTGTQEAPNLLFDRKHTFALLDLQPASSSSSSSPSSPGQSLLIVKLPIATLLEASATPIPRDVMADVMEDLQALTSAVQAATRCDGVQVQQRNGPAAGQTVPQLHFHVIPCFEGRGNVTTEPEAVSRPMLSAEEAGPLISKIQNALPESYSPGLSIWAASAEDMERVGYLLQEHLVKSGMVALLHGQLGAGKTTIARGFVRSFCKAPLLDVASPTYLLCLSYAEDLGHEPEMRMNSDGNSDGNSARRRPSVHHMDPYRLGVNSDKMSGLIDFESAFKHDVCLIEWPDRMPKAAMALPHSGVQVRISGTGAQGVGRLVKLLPLSPDDPSATVLRQWRTGGVPSFESLGSSLCGPTNQNGNSTVPGRQLLFRPGNAMSANPEEWVVLGIESSCDDTAAAVIRGDGRILSHRVASQVGLHEQYGGVKPDVARQAHAAAIHGVVEGCLEEAGVQPQQLTAVAATVGPGLALCLQVGVKHALSLASEHSLPFIPIHHMEAHALITRMPGIIPIPMTFPALLLLVSGGHNMLVLCEGVGRHRVIGTSMDDSVGECFDKVARLLGITAIPGGPKLEELASKGDASRFKLTMPMQSGMYKDTCNFSFSGLKTSVSRLVEQEMERLEEAQELTLDEAGPAPAPAPAAGAGAGADSAPAPGGAGADGNTSVAPALDGAAVASGNSTVAVPAAVGAAPPTAGATGAAPQTPSEPPRKGGGRKDDWETVKADIAAAFQSMSVKFLKQRTLRALHWMKEDSAQHGGPMVTCLVVAGGVAANKSIRAAMEVVASEFDVPCVFPPIKYCTDNGLMVAWTGVERLRLGLYKQAPQKSSPIDEHVEVVPRWPIGPLDPRSSVQGGVKSKMYK